MLHEAQAGDGNALEKLLRLYEGSLYRYARRMCRNEEDAKDVLQDSLLAVARNVDGFREEAKVSTWLYTIARRNCMRRSRRSKFAPSQVESLDGRRQVEEPTAGPDAALHQRELREALELALASLDDTNREILVLRDVEGLTAPEVGAVLGMTEAQVKSRLHRARVRLREAMGPQFDPRPGADQGPAGCPDVDLAFSRFLEGEISPDMCHQLQAHVEGCERCSTRCDALKATLRVCHAVPVPKVPDDVQAAVRDAIREELARGSS